MYPPIPTQQWGQFDQKPQPAFHYAGSEAGYEPSLRSADRLLPADDNPYDQQFSSAPYMQAAPSYHSNPSTTDLRQRPWDDLSMPAVPNHAHYTASPEQTEKGQYYGEDVATPRPPTVQDDYQPMPRDLLYERSLPRRRTSQQMLQQNARPESEMIDFGAYYAEEEPAAPPAHQPPRGDSRRQQSRR
jgi:hypothetical protein